MNHLLLWLARCFLGFREARHAPVVHSLRASSHSFDWPAWLTAGGTLLLAAGVIVAVVQLGELKRDRHLQWIFEIGRRWDDEKLELARVHVRELERESHDALAKKMATWLDLSKSTPDLDAEMTALARLPGFFEDVALMIEWGKLDVALAWESISGPAEGAWKQWAKAIGVRREIEDPDAYSQFESLVDKFAEYKQERDARIERPPIQRLARWASGLLSRRWF